MLRLVLTLILILPMSVAMADITGIPRIVDGDTIHIGQTSGKHLLTLVNDILDLSAIEAGKQSIFKEELSSEKMVAECIKIVSEDAKSKGIELVMKAPGGPSSVYADKRAVKQILLNLLSNAVKFTPEGGKVTVSAKALKKSTALKVVDTG